MTTDDLLELELHGTLRDLEGYIKQAESNPSKFVPQYYELITKISEAASKLSTMVALADMPDNTNFSQIKVAGL